VAVEPRLDLRERNWLAVLALWTALATWLILIGTAVAIGSDAASEDILNTIGWVALGFGTAALVLSVAGVTMIRARGDGVVAILALVLTLSLTSFASPFLLYPGL
jgi:hypothetical protein